MNDFQFAARTLRKSPAFTAIAVLTLAIGIGANTAVFSLVHAVILKPLPFRSPAQLITVWDAYAPQIEKAGISVAEMAEWQRQTDLLSESAWYRSVPASVALTGAGGDAAEVQATLISPGLLPMLAVAPALGHGIAPTDPATTAILSDKIWRTRFSSDPAIVGKSIRMNGEAYAVAGVMPPDFAFPDWADVWLPNGPLMADGLTNPVRHPLGFVARMRPGVTTLAVSRRATDVARRLATQNPKTSTGWSMHAAGLQDDLTANVRPALLMLLGAVTLVLLIACANVANLLLSRAASRTKEIALRTALGAGAGRLVRQLLAESLTLSALGAGLGLLLAEICLRRFSPVAAPLDSAVLWFLAAVAIATALLFGLVPAAQILDASPVAVIKSNSLAAGGSQRLRAALVIAEFSLALILAAGAGILVKSFLHMMHVDAGFDPAGVLTLRLSIPPSTQSGPIFHRIETALRTLPGVESVAASNSLPTAGSRALVSRFLVPGSPLSHPDAPTAAQVLLATPELFQALRIPMRSGRAFIEKDTAANSDSIIINETMARRFWPGRDPVGLKFITALWEPTPGYSTIVGVAGDVKRFGLDSEPTLDMYFPAPGANYLVIRGSGNIAALAPSVRAAIRAIDPELPVSDVRTLGDVVAESARSRRSTMALLSAFASLALALALIGIYGVMAWIVGQRTREIGIRMALGANASQVRAMVVRYSLRLSAAGMAIGLAGAFALRRVLASLVFDVSPSDPAIYAGVAALLLAAALLASYVPARRASRVDPSVALRWE
jgi:putative ABC transport system permease protein